MLKGILRGALGAVLGALILTAGHDDYRPSALDLAMAPHRYSLVRWELDHALQKWSHKVGASLPWTRQPVHGERVAQTQEFFALGKGLHELERGPSSSPAAAASPLAVAEGQAQGVRGEISRIRERRRQIQAEVEETVESEISAVLSQEGFSGRTGLIFPPVDAAFSDAPLVLVMSPRDRIFQQSTTLLLPRLSNRDKEELEELVLRERNLSALVDSTSGVAAYPSIVSDAAGLHETLVLVAHEWLHHWFFFRPLGQRYWSGAAMTTLNETAATMGGWEIGDRALTAMTGQTVSRGPAGQTGVQPGGFDLNAAMRETRRGAEQLLAEGKIEAAEAYMEERRLLMVAHGYRIRKLNQAFFAFHGAYATSPASISPIHQELQELRRRSRSLGEFLRTVAQFGSHQELVDYLGKASVPAPLAPMSGR